MERSSKLFLWAISLSVAVVIIATGYKFLIQKDYNFLVEAECNPSTETCFHRDCTVVECPPNHLQDYKKFSVPASDFPKCSSDSCATECANHTITCKEIVCDKVAGDECTR